MLCDPLRDPLGSKRLDACEIKAEYEDFRMLGAGMSISKAVLVCVIVDGDQLHSQAKAGKKSYGREYHVLMGVELAIISS